MHEYLYMLGTQEVFKACHLLSLLWSLPLRFS